MAAYFAQHNWQPPPTISDAAFARRVHLDVLGLLPTPEEARAFLENPQPDKREQLVRRLLDDQDTYVGHWMTFWSDHLRIGSDVDGGVFDNDLSQAPRELLREMLRSDLSYKDFVHQLITGDFFAA